MDYTELVTEAARRTGQGDLPNYASTLIKLAEADIQQHLRASGMDTEVILRTSQQGTVRLPDDMLDIRHVRLVQGPLEKRPLFDVKSRQHCGYAIQGVYLISTETETEHTVAYFAAIPSLPDQNNKTNWLLSRHPNIYLYGLMTQAYLASMEAEPAAVSRQFLIDQIQTINQTQSPIRYGSTRIGSIAP